MTFARWDCRDNITNYDVVIQDVLNESGYNSWEFGMVTTDDNEPICYFKRVEQ